MRGVPRLPQTTALRQFSGRGVGSGTPNQAKQSYWLEEKRIKNLGRSGQLESTGQRTRGKTAAQRTESSKNVQEACLSNLQVSNYQHKELTGTGKEPPKSSWQRNAWSGNSSWIHHRIGKTSQWTGHQGEYSGHGFSSGGMQPETA